VAVSAIKLKPELQSHKIEAITQISTLNGSFYYAQGKITAG
jgi:hypothetical protein